VGRRGGRARRRADRVGAGRGGLVGRGDLYRVLAHIWDCPYIDLTNAVLHPGLLDGLDPQETIGAALLHVPLHLAVGVIYVVRRPALTGYVVAVVASTFAAWVGLRFTAVTAYVLFTLIALMSIPRNTGRRTSYALAVVGLAQLAMAWVWPPISRASRSGSRLCSADPAHDDRAQHRPEHEQHAERGQRCDQRERHTDHPEALRLVDQHRPEGERRERHHHGLAHAGDDRAGQEVAPRHPAVDEQPLHRPPRQRAHRGAHDRHHDDVERERVYRLGEEDQRDELSDEHPAPSRPGP
jgi:hypothetical protein